MSNRRAQDERIEGTPDGVNAISEIVDIPDAPTIGTATAGIGSASVAFTAATTGGTASTYTAISNPGSITGTSATSPITVSGLTPGTSYTFTARGSNSTGTGPFSSASNSISPDPIMEGAYDALADVTLSATATSVTFAGIPSGYKHLQIRGIARSDRAASGSYIKIQFNGDTANNYANHGLFGTGSSAGAYAVTTTDHAGEAYITAASDTASTFGASVWDVLDYANVSKNKTVRALTGADVNGVNGQFRFASGVWMSTSGITSVTLVDGNGANFVANTSFALFGVK